MIIKNKSSLKPGMVDVPLEIDDRVGIPKTSSNGRRNRQANRGAIQLHPRLRRRNLIFLSIFFFNTFE